MFEISAPYPLIDALLSLPNPQFSDSESLADEVIHRRAIDGTLYTFVKTKAGRRVLKWDFEVTRNKGLETEAFIRLHVSDRWRVVDHNSRVWLGYVRNTPFELRSDGRAEPAVQAWPVGERQSFTIEFEGVQQ